VNSSALDKIYIAGLSLVASAGLLLVAATGLLWWLLSVPDPDTYWRNKFPQDVALHEMICEQSERGGLLEASSIAIFSLDFDIAARVGRDGLSFLNGETPLPNDRKWVWTPWMPVGSTGDALPPGGRGSAENGASRARMFVSLADQFTGNRCREEVKALDWTGAIVRFEHPVNWPLEMCDDSCLAQVLLPASRLAIAATYD
jgi:hypothetical protein